MVLTADDGSASNHLRQNWTCNTIGSGTRRRLRNGMHTRKPQWIGVHNSRTHSGSLVPPSSVCTIRYKMIGVPLDKTTVSLGQYYHDLFQNWATSTDPLFVTMRHYAAPLAEEMHLPAKFSGMDHMEYLVCWHNLGSFQHKRTTAAFAHCKKSMITNPEPFLGCTQSFSWTRELQAPGITEDKNIEFHDPTPTIPIDLWHWTEDITTQAYTACSAWPWKHISSQPQDPNQHTDYPYIISA
jgi:hypothetical protein